MASQQRPLPAVTLGEVLATSDVPGGVVNLLTGRTAEMAPWLAAHMDVNAIDLVGAAAEDAAALEVAAADNLKRVRPPAGQRAGLGRRARPEPDHGVPGDEDRLASRSACSRHPLGFGLVPAV